MDMTNPIRDLDQTCVPLIPDWQLRLVGLYRNLVSIAWAVFMFFILVTLFIRYILIKPLDAEFVFRYVLFAVPLYVFIRCVVFYPADPAILRGYLRNRIWLAIALHYIAIVIAVSSTIALLQYDWQGSMSLGILFVINLVFAHLYPNLLTEAAFYRLKQQTDSRHVKSEVLLRTESQ